MARQHSHKEGGDVHHMVPLSTYYKVYGALIFCTILTVGVSSRVTGHNLGTWSDVIALAIASVKAGLVLAIFMHLKYEGKMNRVLLGTAFFFVVVLYFFCALDIFTRVMPINPLG